MTLPNTTPTDLFCSTQILLPAGDQIFLGGGDNWNTTVPNATNNLGNNNSNTFSVSSNLLTPGPNMNRPRWYATFDDADQRRDPGGRWQTAAPTRGRCAASTATSAC
jgi:hypothetical protein